MNSQEITESHESFGTISFSRATSSGKVPLFNSSILHDSIIIMEVCEAERVRNLSQNWIHQNKTLLRAVMSPSQFADALTSMNMGSGIPITLEYVIGDTTNRQKPPAPKEHQQFQTEIRDHLKEAIDLSQEIIDQSKGQLKRKAEKLNQHLRSNLPFVENQFARQMDKTVAEAKAEIETFLSMRERQAGLQALHFRQEPHLAQLDSPDTQEQN